MALVADALEVDVAHLGDLFGDWPADPPERLEVAPSVSHLADPDEAGGHDRATVQAVRQEGMRTRRHGVAGQGHRARSVGQQIAPGAEGRHGGRLGGVEIQIRDESLSADRMEAELELGDDPEVATAAA